MLSYERWNLLIAIRDIYNFYHYSIGSELREPPIACIHNIPGCQLKILIILEEKLQSKTIKKNLYQVSIAQLLMCAFR